MKSKEIRDLIDFISNTGLNEVSIETEELKLSIVRDPKVKTQGAPIQVQAPVVNAAPVTAPAPATTAAEVPTTEASSSTDNYIEIKSPMIGTFYRSINPETPPFVSIGDKVDSGKPVCIIEAMKLFNEIESEVSGTIVKVMVENASPVEYDQVLFLVDPS